MTEISSNMEDSSCGIIDGNDGATRNDSADNVDPIRDLLRRYRQGDAAVANHLFGILAEDLTSVVRALVRKQMPTGHQARCMVESQDVMHSALGSGIRRLDEFRGDSAGEFFSWLRAIIRTKVRKAMGPIRENGRLSHDPPDDADSVLLQLLEEELRQQLWRLIAQLRSDSRVVVQLRLAGRTTSDIAQILGIRESAVRKRESRAVNSMKDKVARRDEKSA